MKKIGDTIKHYEKIRCVLCKKMFSGWGNNPAPVKLRGLCCDVCNTTKVIPARIKQLQARQKNY